MVGYIIFEHSEHGKNWWNDIGKKKKIECHYRSHHYHFSLNNKFLCITTIRIRSIFVLVKCTAVQIWVLKRTCTSLVVRIHTSFLTWHLIVRDLLFLAHLQPLQSTRWWPEVHIYVYITVQCIARIGVNDMHDLCGQRKTTRHWTTL